MYIKSLHKTATTYSDAFEHTSYCLNTACCNATATHVKGMNFDQYRNGVRYDLGYHETLIEGYIQVFI